MLLSYSLSVTVHFATRSQYQSTTAIDNIFIDIYKTISYKVFPLRNGLSDHDEQLLIMKDVNLQMQNHCIHTIRNINKQSIEEYKTRLSYESWDSIFGNNGNMDVDSLLNLFLKNYLRIFYTSFPIRKRIENTNNNSWIITGIKISCSRKKPLCITDSDDINLKNYYKQYSKILTNVIKEAKRSMYNNQIINSNNKMKTT